MSNNFFDSINKSFVDVHVDKEKNYAIETTGFLEASESLVTFFDLFGFAAFEPVKGDMTGNIKKIRDYQLAAPAESGTLQSLCFNELKTKKHTATEALVWLVRGLDFIAQALRHNNSNPSDELLTSLRTAYGQAQMSQLGMRGKPVFHAVMSAFPYRKDFYAKLRPDQAKGKVQSETLLSALEFQVNILKTFLASKEARW